MEDRNKLNDSMIYLKGVDIGVDAVKDHILLELKKVKIEDPRDDEDIRKLSSGRAFMLGQINMLAKITEIVRKDWLNEPVNK